jgi:hypothetical protein
MRSQLDELERRTTPRARERRARTLAETIIDLSDSIDTQPGDVAASA